MVRDRAQLLVVVVHLARPAADYYTIRGQNVAGKRIHGRLSATTVALMAHSQRRILPAVLATSALLFTLTACGAQDAPASTESSSDVAPESPPEASDETGTSDATGASDGPVTGAATSADAAQFIEDFTRGIDAVETAVMSMKLNDPNGSVTEMTGTMDYVRDPIAMTMTMPSPEDPTVTMETVMVDGVMYMNMGDMSQNKWVEATGFSEASDPIGEMRDFSQAITEVVHNGPVDLDGIPAEHYTVTVEPSLMPAGALEPGTMLPETVTYEIYLDGEGRPAGMDIEMMGGSVITRMTNFNEPVTIEAPPADQIISFEEFQGGR